MVAVRTVLGDLPAADLGPTNYHEHLFRASPLLVGDELDSGTASGQEAVLVEAALVANPARLLARFPAPEAVAKETHG